MIGKQNISTQFVASSSVFYGAYETSFLVDMVRKIPFSRVTEAPLGRRFCPLPAFSIAQKERQILAQNLQYLIRHQLDILHENCEKIGPK